MTASTRLAAALALLAGSAAWAGDWANWRGPLGTGVSSDGPLPDTWAVDGENMIWKARSSCRSGPIVMNGRVYLIDAAGDKEAEIQERVACFDATDGRLVWEHRFNVFHTDVVTSRVGWANVCGDPETGNVYAHGVQGLFFCFDRDGKILWQKSLTEEYGRVSGFGGRTNSPIVDENLVIFSSLFSNWGPFAATGHRYVAFDKRTGEIVWWCDTGRPPNDTTYSVPIVRVVGGVRMLLAANADGWIYGIKVRTGEIVWRFQLSRQGINPSIVAEGDLVYACHGDENIDNTSMGRVVCIRATGKGDVTRTHEVWRADGLAVGYASPVLHDGKLYVCDNSANLHCLDAGTGKHLWEVNYGTIAKGSPVWADGKIYVGEVNARFVTIKPQDGGAKVIGVTEFKSPNTSVLEVNGSPAVAGGRLVVPTAEWLYCVGLPQGKSGPPLPDPIAAEPPADSQAQPAWLQVVPADVILEPGDSVRFRLRAFDAMGRFIKDVTDARWQLPSPPPPPTSGPMAGAAPSVALKGTIAPDGTFTADPVTNWQAAMVSAQAGELSVRARVRVAPTVPFKLDFEDLPENGGIPGVIDGQASKVRVTAVEGGKVLRKLANNAFASFARVRIFLTPPIPAGHTVSADLMGQEKRRNLPNMGLINCRYVLLLRGDTIPAQIQLATWEFNKPNPRIEKLVDFDWKPQVWYRMKLRVEIEDGRGMIRGKIWPRDEREPDEWTVTINDSVPNPEGSPGLYGYSSGVTRTTQGTEIFYDNVSVE